MGDEDTTATRSYLVATAIQSKMNGDVISMKCCIHHRISLQMTDFNSKHAPVELKRTAMSLTEWHGAVLVNRGVLDL